LHPERDANYSGLESGFLCLIHASPFIPFSCNFHLAGRIRALKREEFEERTVRGALRSGADLPPQQLPRDAERITSRRRLFLGTFPQGSPPFDAALGLFSRRARAALTCPKNGPLPPHHAAFRAKTLPRGESLPRPRVSVPRGYLGPLAGHSQGKPTGVRKTLLVTARPATPKVRRADGDRFDDRLFSIRLAIGRPARLLRVICSADHDGRQTTC
jgi:hypothetical protein